ncbi:MAG: ABC transporter substrate-binding protein, partial [Phyllobacterium sp.]
MKTRLKQALFAIMSQLLTVPVAAGLVQAQDLKLAVGQRGAWDTSIAEMGVRSGIFKKHGLEVQILYTRGGAEPQQAVMSR